MKNKIKKIIFAGIILSIVIVISLIVAMVVNINKLYSDYQEQELAITKESDDEDYNLVENYEEASSSIGSTVEELEKQESIDEEEKTEEMKEVTEKSEEVEKTEVKQDKQQKKEEVVEIPDPIFSYPVDGDIIKGYSKENLVYSETLKEWTTHTGIDIQAELTTVVKASCEGKIKAIKNDPRYGLTVIIEHVNGYETRYSNLLTAEFVKIGESVTKGQTIGTVGNTASFEIADKPHLHFEILKNNEYLEPTAYMQ